MKQILNINLGGHPVTIDTDAYDHLSRYLDAIEKHFKESDAAEEILSDIETRMAELFKENIHPRTIVTMPDVNSAIDIMGTPEMFGAEAIDEDEPVAGTANKQKKKGNSGFNPGKRLFRDSESKILGGVSSGLAAYLGVGDPVWVRIAFILFTLLGFASVPIYIILWIVMPMSKTSADRLAMKGEPINVESIASSVVEELENFSDKINDKFGPHKKKSGGRRDRDRHRQGKKFLVALGGIVSTIIIGVTQVAKPLLKILGSIIIVVLLVSWIVVVVASAIGIAKADFFLPTNTFAFSIGAASLFLLVGAPIMGLILTILRVFFKQDHHIKWRWGLVSLWFVGLFGMSFTVAKVTNSYEGIASSEQIIQIQAPQDHKPLVVSRQHVSLANNDARSIFFKKDNIRFDWNEIKLNVKASVDDQYKLVQVQTARGSDGEDAAIGAKMFEYQPVISGDKLMMPSNYFIPKGERFRVQKVKLILYVPVGEKIIIDKNMRRFDLVLDEVSGVYGSLLGEELVMTAEGLKRLDTEEKIAQIPTKISTNGTQVLALKDFNAIDVTGPVVLTIQQGTLFRVKIRGTKEGDPVNLKVYNEELIVNVADDLGKEIEVYITMPNLDRLTAKNTHEIHLSDFKGEQLMLDFQGDMAAKLSFELEKLVLVMSGNSKLELEGRAEIFEAKLSDDSVLDGKVFKVAKVNMEASPSAFADVMVDGDLVHYGKE